MPILARIQGITREAAGWPETMAMAPMVVAGVRAVAGLVLWCANGQSKAPELLYSVRRTHQTHARDQKVTVATPTLSSGGSAFRSR